MALLTLSSTHPTPAQQMRSIRPTTRKPASSLQSLASLAVIASIAWPSSSVSAALAPYPVGGFAMCQTGSSLHIQGGVSYSLSATYLVTTNQHFRLDLSQSFDSAPSSTKPPVWANLTSDYSPFQRFHAGACTPDQASFLTVGNADAMNTGAGGSGFMMAYSVAKGTWTPVTQAVSGATNSNNQNSQKAGGGGLMAAGRTMPGFAVGGATKSLGVVIGGGWLPQKSNTASAMGTDLTNLVTEADLIAFGSDGSLSSLNWSVAPAGGNGGSNINQNLGPVAGSKVVPLSSPGGKAVVLGGVTGSRGNGNGLSFANLSIVDMVTGAVVIQKATSSTPNGIPSPRYGHCAALSTDGNTIIMFGGSLVANDKVTNDLYALDTRTWTWSQPALKTTPLSPVRDHQCVVIGDQFLSLFGFNANQAPSSTSSNSSGNSGSSTPIPSVPPIYVLSVSQWAWSTQYTPLPGTPSPPTPPSVPTNGSKNKVNGVAIAFGTIFGLAFLGVVGYLVFAHKRRQKRKAETLLLIEIQEQKKEEAKLEKERLQRQQQQQDAPLPPVPVSAHTNDNGNYQDYNDYNANYHGAGNQGGAFYPPVAASTAPSMSHYRATDPFQNPTYLQHQNSHHQLEPIPYYAQAGGSAAGEGLDLYPFAYPPPVSSQQQQDSPVFVPEEMGYISPMLPGSHNMPGNAADNFKVPVEDGRMGSGGRLASGARDKMSFIDPGPIYR